jgi:hypothetical protein
MTLALATVVQGLRDIGGFHVKCLITWVSRETYPISLEWCTTVIQLLCTNHSSSSLEVCKFVVDVTFRGENVVHIALKNDVLKAFWYLVRWVRGACFKDAKMLEEKPVLEYCTDDEGNTRSVARCSTQKST